MEEQTKEKKMGQAVELYVRVRNDLLKGAAIVVVVGAAGLWGVSQYQQHENEVAQNAQVQHEFMDVLNSVNAAKEEHLVGEKCYAEMQNNQSVGSLSTDCLIKVLDVEPQAQVELIQAEAQDDNAKWHEAAKYYLNHAMSSDVCRKALTGYQGDDQEGTCLLAYQKVQQRLSLKSQSAEMDVDKK